MRLSLGARNKTNYFKLLLALLHLLVHSAKPASGGVLGNKSSALDGALSAALAGTSADIGGLLEGGALRAVARGAGGPPVGSLDTIIEHEATRLVQSDGCMSTDGSGIARYMDQLAKITSSAVRSKHADSLIQELSNSINMMELVATKVRASLIRMPEHRAKLTAVAPPTIGLPDLLHSPKLPAKARIVHAPRQLSEKGLQELKAFGMEGPVPYARFVMGRYYMETQLKKKNLVTESMRNFLVKALKAVVNLADQLYMSPVFLESLPIIGTEITKLKQKGRTVYDIIQAVRSIRTFLDLKKELSRSNVKAAFSSQDSQKMLTKAGLDALKWVAIEIVKRKAKVNFNNGDIKEIIGRCAYYLFIHLAPKSSLSCTLPRSN